MAYETGAFETTLAAAAGEDSALFAELRGAFIESLAHQIDLLSRARCDGNWQVAAMRIKGLGASFHADSLVDLASEALEGAPGDPAVLRKLNTLLSEIAAH